MNELAQIFNEYLEDSSIRTVQIKTNPKDSYLVEISEAKHVALGTRLSDILSKHGYQELVVKTEKGRIVFASITTKYKVPR